MYGQIFLSKTDRYEKGSIIPNWFGFDIPVKDFGNVIEVDPYELIHNHKSQPGNARIPQI